MIAMSYSVVELRDWSSNDWTRFDRGLCATSRLLQLNIKSLTGISTDGCDKSADTEQRMS